MSISHHIVSYREGNVGFTGSVSHASDSNAMCSLIFMEYVRGNTIYSVHVYRLYCPRIDNHLPIG